MNFSVDHYSGELSYLLIRSELTKYVITPAFGVSGVGGVMAIYGGFDAVVIIIFIITVYIAIKSNFIHVMVKIATISFTSIYQFPFFSILVTMSY